jgi:hypothetical protein
MNWDFVEKGLLDIIYYIKTQHPNHNSLPKVDAVLDPLWVAHRKLKPLQEDEE